MKQQVKDQKLTAGKEKGLVNVTDQQAQLAQQYQDDKLKEAIEILMTQEQFGFLRNTSIDGKKGVAGALHSIPENQKVQLVQELHKHLKNFKANKAAAAAAPNVVAPPSARSSRLISARSSKLKRGNIAPPPHLGTSSGVRKVLKKTGNFTTTGCSQKAGGRDPLGDIYDNNSMRWDDKLAAPQEINNDLQLENGQEEGSKNEISVDPPSPKAVKEVAGQQQKPPVPDSGQEAKDDEIQEISESEMAELKNVMAQFTGKATSNLNSSNSNEQQNVNLKS